MNMPDYAEVAGCSSFKNPASPLYDSCGAYATTNLVKNANLFTNNFHAANVKQSSLYSAPTSCHYNDETAPSDHETRGSTHAFAYSESNFPMYKHTTTKSATNSPKMNIVENQLDAINNLNRSVSTASVPAAQMLHHQLLLGHNHLQFGGTGTIKRNGGQRLPKIGHSDKLSFGGGEAARSMEQPLFVKSKEDGSWTTVVQNSTYQYQVGSGVVGGSGSGEGDSSSTTQLNSKSGGHFGNNLSNTSPIYLSSFGKSDNV